MRVDRIEGNAYGPTPPPEISALGAPILTSDEYDNNRQFLDFFTTNGPEDSEILDSLHPISQDLLPNFHGASSAFGRPDLIHYEQSDPLITSHAQHRSDAPYANLFPTKDNSLIIRSNDRGNAAGQASPGRAFQLYENPYYSLDGHQSQFSPSSHQDQSYDKRAALGFGSDSSFASRHYAPPPGTEDIGVIEGRVLETLNSFQPAHSASNTQPSSPATKRKRALPALRLDESTDTLNHAMVSQKLEKPRVETNARSSDIASTPLPRKKLRVSQKLNSPPIKNHPQRRRSRAIEPKRQNLTEKEKKENHIRSEQKRRNQIKEGFASLLALMPDGSTEGSGSSKCLVLAKAVDWLTDLRDGNQQLRTQLKLLDATRT